MFEDGGGRDGEGLQGSAGGGGVAGAVLDDPGGALSDAVGDAGRGLGRARQAVEVAWRLAEDEVAAGLEALMGVRAATEAVLLTLVREGLCRGLPATVGLSARDWVAARCPWLSGGEVGELVTVAQGLDRRGHEELRETVEAGGVPLRRVARLLRALARIAPACDEQTYAASVATLLPVVTDPAFTEADLTKATDHLVAVALSHRETQARERATRDLRGVHESSLADGSLTRFVVTCDAEGAALLRSVLTSPLAAPAPDATGPDPRTATQRRYDAVITVLGRGMSAPAGVARTGKAKIFLTMSYDPLKDALVGAGHTLTGEALTAGQVRRLACEADLVPVVVGSESQVLDLGRSVRLAGPAQVQRLWLRDRGCSFPGCTVPPTWCDAHHLTWWSRGGRTDLRNLALLCGRHHTLVHDRDLAATVTDTCVTWHV